VSARLSVEGLACRAGTLDVLRGVSFDVGPGELVALMGRNGAGKSTLMNAVAGLARVRAGTVRLEGRLLSDWTAPERARLVAHLPQTVHADLAFTAEQLVLMGRYPHADRWFESDGDRAAVDEAMRRTGCLAFRDRRVSTLSGGERQRVLLAACLAQDPRLLLLDEPSTFLDVDQQLHCFSLLLDTADRGAACIAVTHDLNLALRFCSRLIVLAEGGIALDRPVAAALADPAWLSLFSERLRLQSAGGGRPWVAFE
jgi:iron complex transport system ATP-binding protein